MKRVEFEGKDSFGYFEIPDDAKLKIHKGIQVNTEEPLLPAGLEFSTQGAPGAASTENEDHLIPPSLEIGKSRKVVDGDVDNGTHLTRSIL